MPRATDGIDWRGRGEGDQAAALRWRTARIARAQVRGPALMQWPGRHHGMYSCRGCQTDGQRAHGTTTARSTACMRQRLRERTCTLHICVCSLNTAAVIFVCAEVVLPCHARLACLLRTAACHRELRVAWAAGAKLRSLYCTGTTGRPCVSSERNTGGRLLSSRTAVACSRTGAEPRSLCFRVLRWRCSFQGCPARPSHDQDLRAGACYRDGHHTGRHVAAASAPDCSACARRLVCVRGNERLAVQGASAGRGAHR